MHSETDEYSREIGKDLAIFIAFFALGLGSIIFYLYDNGSSQANLVGASMYVVVLNIFGYLMDSVPARWGASLPLFIPVALHVELL